MLRELRDHDAILLGAVGDPTVPSGILERGLLLRIRFELDHHVNLRPARLYPGVPGPLAGDKAIDLVVLREGTEGPYAGNGGLLRKDTPHEIATEVSLNTYFGVERVVRDAFERAARRPRKHLTLVHKTNVLVHSGQLWSRVVEEVSMEYPDVSVAYSHIDAAMIYLVTDPGRFDVVVTDNLFGDIFTDLAAAVSRAASGSRRPGNLDVSRTNPSMFEPVHGSAPGHRGHRSRPTRPRPCCPSRCCWTTSGCRRPRAGSRPPWRSTWPPGSPARSAAPRRSATGWLRSPRAERDEPTA